MPNNCSTLIQRKQNILHKILRSSSDGKLQNAVTETTADLCISGTRKTPVYSNSMHHLTGPSTTRQSNLFAGNRLQSSSNNPSDSHLPSIRDTYENGEKQPQLYNEFRSNSRSRTPIANSSPKSTGNTPTASLSSIYQTLAKRSTENFNSIYGDFEEAFNPVPPTRRSQRTNRGNGLNQTTTKQTNLPQKQPNDNSIDSGLLGSPGDTNQRGTGVTTQYRMSMPQQNVEYPPIQGTKNKEKPSQHYLRRSNYVGTASIKQKIEKYRRRNEETALITNTDTPINTTNNGLSTTPPTLARSKQRITSPRDVYGTSSDAEIKARVEALRLSMDTNVIYPEQKPQTQSSHNRVKSPYFYNTHQPVNPITSTSNAQTPLHGLQRSYRYTQPPPTENVSHRKHSNSLNNRRAQHQRATPPSPGNFYLAYVASRRLSSNEDALLEYDIDHQKVLQIFTWLRNVEEHRHEQADHDKLLIEQQQCMLDQEENLSLYSEVKYAVDEIPANVNGAPCERIPTMQFEK